MGFWKILGWLSVFVIGSLIVTFLVTPNSFNIFKNNAKNMMTSAFVGIGDKDIIPTKIDITNITNTETPTATTPIIEVSQSPKIKKVIIPTDLSMFYACSTLKINAGSQGLDENSIMQYTCENFCGNPNGLWGNYSYDLISWNCDKDKLTCNCG